jgi:hypothetical protein
MKQYWLGIAAIAALSACGDGNPFAADGGGGGTDGGGPTVTDPALTGELSSVSYNPTAQTLVVNGMTFDGGPATTLYTRNAALDRAGYEAYSSQNSPLDRHYTAYVKSMDGVNASIVVAGGQFGYYFGGSTYSRNGTYSAPASGQVTYVGNYVGLTNSAGDGGDLLAPPAGTDPFSTPNQSAEITGRVTMTANFNSAAVEGAVTNRVVVDGATPVIDLELQSTGIESSGTFAGSVTQLSGTKAVGDYGGIFGGTGASAVAGTLFVNGHITSNSEEYGMFVLSQCGTANADPGCP